MMCTKCGDTGILNTAGGKEFYFCRTCRNEIMLETVDMESDLEFDAWVKEVTGDAHSFIGGECDDVTCICHDYPPTASVSLYENVKIDSSTDMIRFETDGGKPKQDDKDARPKTIKDIYEEIVGTR